jgi:hypothetical protein
MENFITIQKYASLHRLSIHTVLKKTMSGELPSVEKEENGKKVIYVQYGNVAPEPKTEAEPASEEEIDYKKAYEDLNREYLLLKTRYERLLEESKKG